VRAPSDLPRRRQPKPRTSHRGRIALIVVVALVIALFLSAQGIASFYTDYLWFDSLGFGKVFTGVLKARIALAVIFSLAFAALLVVNLFVADKLAPRVRAPGPEEQFIERYQSLVRRRGWLVRGIVALILGLIAGVPVAGQWRDWLLFTHATKFDVKDPLFGVDVGFYVFRLPFLTFLVEWLFAAVVIVLIVTLVAHYLNGGIRLQAQGRRVTPQVKLHISVLLAALALLRAAGYWLDRYQLVFSTRGAVDGATYTDVKAQLSALNVLMLISLLAAVLLIINVWQRGWRLPIIAVGLWGVVAVVAGTAYPAFVQRFQVQPTESTREQPYIERNIKATRAAMGLDKVEEVQYPVQPLDSGGLEDNEDSLRNVRLLAPDVVQDTFQRVQGLRGYYRFNELDVDRYDVKDTDGTTRMQQVVLAVRELNEDGLPQKSWENQHLAYTHGYGVALAPASKILDDGQPVFLETQAESAPGPRVDRPEIYVGEKLGGYAVVNTKRSEISLSSGTEAETRYEGEGGVKLSSSLRRAAFALRFSEWNLFGSKLITEESRIIYQRDVRDRVETLAPFLSFDADPYPVLLNGRIKWVIDGYTTTSRYPYAQRADTDQLPPGTGLKHRFNYIRNSVKAVVDAYDGDVTFYIVDPKDPIVHAWSKAFPSLFTPTSEIPTSLRAHFRYPEDMFRVQTNVWGRYHIEDPKQFYNRDDAWSVAQNPPRRQLEPTGQGSAPATLAPGDVASRGNEDRVPPYFTYLREPGSDKLEFLLLRPFVPFSDQDTRKELKAFMTVSSDPDSYGRLRVYTLPGSELPPGPSLVDTNIRQTFAPELTLLDQRGSQVNFGDMQLMPIGDSLVWVRPWFVSATGNTQLPELQYISVTYNNKSYRGTTLEEALERAFPGASMDLGSVVLSGSTGTTSPPSSTPPTTGPPSSTPSTTVPQGTQSVEQLLAEAQQLYDDAQAALRLGDPVTYIQKLDAAYRKAAEAASLATGQTVTPSTTPTSGTTTPTATTTVPNTTTTASA